MTKLTPQGVLLDPIANNNPIALQMLGICSALAVTSRMDTALVMCICVIVVIAGSNVAVSLIREQVPSSIRIIVQILADDGALLAAASHGACLALMHAGVPLRGMVGGCAVASMPDATLLLDPCADEQRDALAVVTSIFCVRRSTAGRLERQLLLSHTHGCVADVVQHTACESAAREAAACVCAFYRHALTRVVTPLIEALPPHQTENAERTINS